VDSVLRIVCLFLLSGSTGIEGSARPANTSQAEQGVQVIEVTAKKYEYTPLPIRVKLGAKVQLKITSLAGCGKIVLSQQFLGRFESCGSFRASEA